MKIYIGNTELSGDSAIEAINLLKCAVIEKVAIAERDKTAEAQAEADEISKILDMVSKSK